MAWLPGDGNAGDIIGTNNGTLENGASFAPGEVGEAFSFNGTNQYVQVADSPSLRPQSVTVECWFNASNAVGALISKPLLPVVALEPTAPIRAVVECGSVAWIRLQQQHRGAKT